MGLAAFKESEAQQESDSEHFLPVPGSSAAIPSASLPNLMVYCASTLTTLLVMMAGL